MAEDQLDLLNLQETKETPKLEKPPLLRVVYSISCSMPARVFFQMLEDNFVTLIMDTRRTREYRGKGFYTSEDDFRYLCERHRIVYEVVEDLAPTKDMRSVFANDFKFVKKAVDRDPAAWTNFLREYENLLRKQRPLRQGRVHDLLYGDHPAIAVVCACQHHEDCHRMLATAMMASTRIKTGMKSFLLMREETNVCR